MGTVCAGSEKVRRNGFRYSSVCRVCRQIMITTSMEWYRASPPRCTCCGGMLDRGSRASRRLKRKHRPPKSAIEAQLQVMRRVAEREGISVRWNSIAVRSRAKKPIYHVIFDLAGKRLLDYWPSNGTARLNGTNTKNVGVHGALEIARRTAGQEPN